MRLKFAKCLNSLKTCSFPVTCVTKSPCTCCSNESSNDTTSLNKPLTWQRKLRLIYYVLFYNESVDSYTTAEAACAPFITCMNQMLRILGWFLVTLVWTLLGNMVFVFYYTITPVLYQTSWPNFVLHFTMGNLLTVNTLFHYAMGLFTGPGYPPRATDQSVTHKCRKCSGMKPPRTHHCSICDRCVLKMDHHCPWFNNCIGFNNHRYFFLFCTFMTIDCVYLSTVGFHYFQSAVFPSKDLNILNLMFRGFGQVSQLTFYYQLVTIEFFVAFVAGFAVFGLWAINAFIISFGATNIELRNMPIPCLPSTHSNPKNPFDLGFSNNWKVFLGFNDLRSFLTRVILPSKHKPVGDGIHWELYFEYARKHFQHEVFIV